MVPLPTGARLHARLSLSPGPQHRSRPEPTATTGQGSPWALTGRSHEKNHHRNTPNSRDGPHAHAHQAITLCWPASRTLTLGTPCSRDSCFRTNSRTSMTDDLSTVIPPIARPAAEPGAKRRERSVRGPALPRKEAAALAAFPASTEPPARTSREDPPLGRRTAASGNEERPASRGRAGASGQREPHKAHRLRLLARARMQVYRR
jgi:hypothetical protein